MNESPNSSDARIITKDVEAYLDFGLDVSYVIITSLPNQQTLKWKLLYTGHNKDGQPQYNHAHGKKAKEIRQNPFKYWYNFYRQELQKYKGQLDNVHFANIDQKVVSFEKI